MVTLNPRQQMLLRNVKRANVAWRNAKAGAVVRAKEIVAAELSEYQAAMDHEVRLAFEAGVPVRRLAMEALGTSDTTTLKNSLRRTDEAARGSRNGRLTVEPLAEHVVFDRNSRVVTVTSPLGETVTYNEHAGQLFDYIQVEGGEPWETSPVLPSGEYTQWFLSNRQTLLQRIEEAVNDN